mmetsp:Transcript_11243/g.47959  ORF Transcript_11243/g.47959 Transcript_11243/m.47959 type:complete len:878 (-) Transcript_11243:2223-4856(-)
MRQAKGNAFSSRPRKLMARNLRRKRFFLTFFLVCICIGTADFLKYISTWVKPLKCPTDTATLNDELLRLLGDRDSVKGQIRSLDIDAGCPEMPAILSSVLLGDEYRNNLLKSVGTSSHIDRARSSHDSLYTYTPRGFRYCDFPTELKPTVDNRLKVVYFLSQDLQDHPGYANFRRSLTQSGFEHEDVIQVFDLSQMSPGSLWLRRLKSYLSRVSYLPSDAIISLMDALDALVVMPPSELVDKYLEMMDFHAYSLDNTVIFGAEELCDTESCFTKGLKENFDALASSLSTPARYLNAGLSIGSAGAYTALLSRAVQLMESDPTLDDQAAFAEIMLTSDTELRIILDYDRRLFFNAPVDSPISNEHLISAQILAGVFHFPGLRYEGNPRQRGNQCQSVLLSSYNSVLKWLTSRTEAPALGILSPPKQKVVVSFTTTPARIDNLLPTINSLSVQTMQPHQIILNVPRISKRFGVEYLIPAYLYRIPGFVINHCDDYGPATKLLGVLDSIKDPETLIITIDDEYMYPANLVETLVLAHRLQPRAAFGFAGQVIDADYSTPSRIAVRSADKWDPSKNASVDILEGFLGAIYKVDFFSPSVYNIPADCFTTDDIWFSAHLASKNIPRIKLSMPFSRPSDFETGNDSKSNLRSNNVVGEKSNTRCAASLLPAFQLSWTKNIEPCSLSYIPLNKFEGAEIQVKSQPLWVRRKFSTSPCSQHYYQLESDVWTSEKGMPRDFYISSIAANTFLHLQHDGNLCARKGLSPYHDDLSLGDPKCLSPVSLTKDEVPILVSEAVLNADSGSIEIYGESKNKMKPSPKILMQSFKVCSSTNDRNVKKENVKSTVSKSGIMAVQIFEGAGKGTTSTVELRCPDGSLKILFQLT